METLKKGSSGMSVMTLQNSLKNKGYKIEIDGKFGEKTESIVKEFQKAHGLVADGIVGEKTWNLLLTGKVSSLAISSDVVYKPLNVHISTLRNRSIKYLAIHFTAGSNSKAGRALSTFNTFTQRSASADFCVDDRDIVQFNPDIANYYCWAVGDKKANSKGGQLYGIATNRNTISIEICSTCIPATTDAVSHSNHTGWSFSNAALDNAAKIAKIIMKKYNIPLDRVVRHYDISGKICPGIIGWNDERIYDLKTAKHTSSYSDTSAWKAFKERLK